MNDNILDLGYEALLRPVSRVRKPASNNAKISATQLQAAKIKFFGLDQLFQFNQKTK